MAVGKDTLFERFLAPIARLFIDEAALRQFYESIDWAAESDRLSDPTLTYPAYYSSQNFHGIDRGYLNISAAVSYDPITQYALPPGEALVRQGLLDASPIPAPANSRPWLRDWLHHAAAQASLSTSRGDRGGFVALYARGGRTQGQTSWVGN